MRLEIPDLVALILDENRFIMLLVETKILACTRGG